MAILYSVVAKKNIILARYAACVGNFAEITDLVLSRIHPEEHSRMSLRSGEYFYHYVSDETSLVFLCIADADFDRARAFTFLSDVRTRFDASYGASGIVANAIPFAMNSEFSVVMAGEMRKANRASEDEAEDESSDDPNKIERLREEVRQVKDVMVSTIDSIVERGERLELLVEKTDALSSESVSFKQNTRVLRSKMWWQNTKMKVMLALVCILIVYGIISASCGGPLWPHCV